MHPFPKFAVVACFVKIKRVVVISSVPGTKVTDALEASKAGFANTVVINLEQRARQLAKEKHGVGSEKESLRNSFLYTLPEQLARDVASQALIESLDTIAKAQEEIGIICLHASFISPLRWTPYQPYIGVDLTNEGKKREVEITSFCSVHDDIYDVHYELLRTKYFTHPGGVDRNPIDDIRDIMFALDWRMQEFSATSSLASRNERPHYLLHKKGLLRNLLDVGLDLKKAVYLSHPISQTRDNWNRNLPSGQPDGASIAIADGFSSEVMEIAAKIGDKFPVFEPTAIDEYRLAKLDPTGTSNIVELLKEMKMSERLLPKLTKRWPLNSRQRLAPVTPNETDDGGYRLAPKHVYPEAPVNGGIGTEGTLAVWIDVLIRKIRTHITVRDYKLTDQSEAVLVYRPHSSTEYSRLSGGVGDEINAKRADKKFTKDYRGPSVFVLHPMKDERKRRELVFDAKIDNEDGTIGYDHQCQQYCAVTPPMAFRTGLKNILLNADYIPDANKIREAISQLVKTSEIHFKAHIDKSVMGEMGFLSAEECEEYFVESFVSGEVLNHSLLIWSSESEPVVEIHDWIEIHDSLIANLEIKLNT